MIPGSRGLRKLRWGGRGRGKRGGLRVIYYWALGEQTFYILYVYAKNEQGDLTPAQVKTLRRVVQEEFR
ncbi:MAG TPA: type II toxin-antitoxin system RelE/ParE family toxin [Gemmatimonadales bacterium]|nr:type II toxin-antitoxin system RelE/ParE family toxin [Gemmatimonadales bacterium]